ncbi:hypothetical protein CN378_20605 [Bacillus sp. AFS015802]|uniref:hypothetical protein n=1 Tax=Bacillus sp. AFS015802 TaxID=2033486 RepID=UPI000BF5C22E|nr:hypothetical protein [Bacillus sp. AFS015802]PFA62365.1 hypothetical protein CN378_20605 [Bacillus sp. AFS015802]
MGIPLLSNRGFILPYTLFLLMIVLFLAFASKDLFISKYRYLSNMKSIQERNISVSHAILLEVQRKSLTAGQVRTNFGEVMTSSRMLTPQEVQLEVTFKREEKVFLPVTVVYNKETKQIIRWE